MNKTTINNPEFDRAIEAMETQTNEPNADTTPEHEPITHNNLYESACKAAYHTAMFLYQQSPTQLLLDYVNGFAHLNDGNDTNELINVASLALLDNMTDNNDNAFPLACKAVRQFIYAQNKQHTTTQHTTLYKQLLKIRRMLNGQHVKASPAQLETLTNIIIDKGITAENIDTFIAQEKAHAQKSYTSTNMYIHDYENANGTIVNVNDEIAKVINGMTLNSVMDNLRKALTPSQLHVLHYVTLGYPDNVIAQKMSISKQRVGQHVKRIREIAYTIYPNGLTDIF